MQRLVKWLLYLAVIALVLLIGYAYIGPYFGADFCAKPGRDSCARHVDR